MAEVEGLKNGLERRQKEYETLEKTLLEKKNEAQSTSTEAETALASLNAEKENIVKSIDRDYSEKIRDGEEGPGICSCRSAQQFLLRLPHDHTGSACDHRAEAGRTGDMSELSSHAVCKAGEYSRIQQA